MDPDDVLRVKPQLRARYIPSPGQISISGHIYGLARTIEDPDKKVWELLNLTDGKCSVNDVIHRANEMIGLGPDDTLAVLTQLVNDGILEVQAPQERDTEWAERHQNTRALLSWMDREGRPHEWALTDLLNKSTVAVIGVGGTGSHAALSLASFGVGHLILVDGDYVDRSNLGRQILFNSSQIGQSKVHAAKSELENRFPDTKVTARCERVEDAEDMKNYLRQADALAVSADEPNEIREWAAQASSELRKPWAGGGYQGPQVSTWLFDTRRPPCYFCVKRHQDETAALHDGQRADMGHWQPSTVNAVAYATAAISGSYLANAVLSLISGVPRIASNGQYFVSIARPEHAYLIGGSMVEKTCEWCSS